MKKCHTTALLTIEDLLKQCGITERTLLPREKDALDKQGYIVFPNVIDGNRLAELRAVFESAIVQGHRHGAQIYLPWHDEVFDFIYSQPKVLAAAYHMLRRSFRTFPPVGREPQQGQGLQALHPDWGRAASEPIQVVTVLWLIDDFTERNGATRVVPGSHLVPKPVPKALLQPERKHSDQKLIIAEAGSALVFNAHLLHSGTRNESGERRRVLQCQFRARDTRMPGAGQYEEPSEAKVEITTRLPAVARFLLGTFDCEPTGQEADLRFST